MITKEQANELAEDLLEPHRQELDAAKAARNQRTEQARSRALSPLFPAAIAAGAALAAFYYLDNYSYALGIGALTGWCFGLAQRRRWS